MFNCKNYNTDGGDTTVIGGTLKFNDGAQVENFPGGGGGDVSTKQDKLIGKIWDDDTHHYVDADVLTTLAQEDNLNDWRDRARAIPSLECVKRIAEGNEEYISIDQSGSGTTIGAFVENHEYDAYTETLENGWNGNLKKAYLELSFYNGSEDPVTKRVYASLSGIIRDHDDQYGDYDKVVSGIVPNFYDGWALRVTIETVITPGGEGQDLSVVRTLYLQSIRFGIPVACIGGPRTTDYGKRGGFSLPYVADGEDPAYITGLVYDEHGVLQNAIKPASVDVYPDSNFAITETSSDAAVTELQDVVGNLILALKDTKIIGHYEQYLQP